VAVGIVCFFTLRSTEPEFGGKPLSRWVEQLFANYPRRDSEARDALRAMGQPAVRFLTRRVEHASSQWRLKLALMTKDIPLVERIFSVATGDRRIAAMALAELGPMAKSAIPALERITNNVDSSLSLATQAALIRIRGQPLESHVATFRQFGTTNSVQSTFLLVELGPYAMSALPALLEGIQSTNEHVRYFATWALSYVGCESPECVPSLQRLLSDPYFTVRFAALDGLANIGPPARTAITNVRQSLQDTNGLVRTFALKYFDKVLSDEEFSIVRDEVLRAKLDPSSTVSEMAQHVLSSRPLGNSGTATNR